MKVTPLRAAVVAALAGYGTTAAQVASSQEAGASAGLEEIVVTAARREQNLQDVPLAVVAFTGEALETQGVENMEDLNAVVPNVIIAGNNASTDTAQFTMRGIPNVGVYVDGIWQVGTAYFGCVPGEPLRINCTSPCCCGCGGVAGGWAGG